MRKRIISFIMIGIIITSTSFSFIGCSKDNKNSKSENVEQKNTENTISNGESKNESKDETKDDTTKEEQQNEEGTKIIEKEADISFTKIGLDKNMEPEFATPWISSLDSKYNICIEGRGESGVEEGTGLIYLKENESGDKWYFQINDGGKQLSPKKIQWIDDKHVALIIGFAHGTIALGGNVYKLNVETGEVNMIYNTGDNKIQVTEINKDGKQLKLDILVYEDDNYIESHTDKKIINLE
ncbi:DUF4652 domain-containing protein [Clostridium sediminicola]|uniref:DUF4652 domain-containing protein n=1 Tax=Clostridium sediminicola TaxID=3114879 RepID=UPI0031F265F4